MSFTNSVTNFFMRIINFVRYILNSITAFLLPRFARPMLARLRTRFPKSYVTAKVSFWVGAFSFIGLVATFALVYLGYFGHIPSYWDLKNIQKAQASEVYSEDNKLIGKYYVENRTNVQFRDISPYILNALVATEDERFYRHSGIDFTSWARVLVKTILMRNENAGGGSTISQQLAKNLFGRERKYGRFSLFISKCKEFILARRLENLYSKHEILTAYLNTVSFGEDTYGIENGSLLFFNKKPKDVTLDEAAILVGCLKAPTAYNPHWHADRAIGRRNTVLSQMRKNKYISDNDYKTYSSKLIALNYNPNARNEGIAPYFREKIRIELQEKLKGTFAPDGHEYNIYTDGLKIYTTIDSRVQAYAEQAAYTHMAKLQAAYNQANSKTKPFSTGNMLLMEEYRNSNRYKDMEAAGAAEADIKLAFGRPTKMKIFAYDGDNYQKEVTISPWDSLLYYHSLLSCGVMALNPKNGHIAAWVGGIDFKHKQFDHVTARRQVGSTFKPIVYAAALENGQMPCDYIPNQLKTFPEWENWRPENSDGKYGGAYSMKGALTNSVNTIAVELLMRAGIDNVINLANRLGITSELPKKPAIALGAGDITLREMVTAYSVFANDGDLNLPVYLLRVEDKNGKIIKTFDAAAPAQNVLSDSLARLTVAMMQGVVDRGTANRLRTTYGFRNDIAGKTGTTQNQTDGWFIGFTPNIVCGVWVGGDDPAVRFKSLALGQGANTALPIWATTMQKTWADASVSSFKGGSFGVMNDSLLAPLLNCPDFVDNMDSVGTSTNLQVPKPPAPPKPNENEKIPEGLKPPRVIEDWLKQMKPKTGE